MCFLGYLGTVRLAQQKFISGHGSPRWPGVVCQWPISSWGERGGRSGGRATGGLDQFRLNHEQFMIRSGWFTTGSTRINIGHEGQARSPLAQMGYMPVQGKTRRRSGARPSKIHFGRLSISVRLLDIWAVL